MYHKFNENQSGEKIINDLKKGKEVAVISDAGMPGISDPGNILVNLCKKEGIPYTVVSGASALVNAFVLSGYEPPFTFVGFLPDNNSKRTALLENLSKVNSVLIFYCSPHSLNEDVESLYKVLGNRDVCFVREISKKFEEVSYSTLQQGFESTLKGEFVVLVDKSKQNNVEDECVDAKLQTLLDMGLTKTEASKVIAKLTGRKKSDIYKDVINN